MKVSVSLPDEAVAFLDDYAKRSGSSRSAAVTAAIRFLRERDLAGAYAKAWEEWETDQDSGLWDTTTGDGIGA